MPNNEDLTRYPLGSNAFPVFDQNVRNLDVAVNDKENESWIDRFGKSRMTWYGMEERFDAFLKSTGYVNIGDYIAGLEITERNQIFWKDGELYAPGASLELPYTTTGDWATEGSLFKAVGDQALRQDLGNPQVSGSLIRVETESGEQNLSDALDNYVPTRDSYFSFLAEFGIQTGTDTSGATDISLVLQNALDTLGTVVLPPGNFKLSAPVTLRSGNTIIGAGHNVTRIFRDVEVQPFDMFTGVGVKDILVSGVFFDSIQKEAVTDPNYRHCAFRFWDRTQYPNPVDPSKKSENIRIIGCRFDKFTSGEVQPEGDRGVILLRNCEHVEVRDSFFRDNRGTCVMWLTANHVFVQDNFCIGEQPPYDTLFQPDQGLGSFTSGQANGVTITGNRIFNTGYTSLNVSGVGVLVADNHIQSPSFSGITVNETDTVTSRVVISGNYIGDPGLDGISVFNVEGCTIVGNFIIGARTAGRAGITLYPTQPQHGPEIPRNVNIVGNSLRANASGLRIRAGAHVVSNGNYYSGNTAGLIIRNETDISVTAFSSGDLFRDNTSFALQLEGQAVTPQSLQVTGALVHSSGIDTSQSRGFISQGALSRLYLGSNTFFTAYDTTQIQVDFSSLGFALYSLEGGIVQALKTVVGIP